MKKIKLSALALALYCSGYAQVSWPAITQQTKPWTRWWWEGSAVNKADLSYNLNLYKEAGLGGMEITPIYGIVGHEKEFINFLSPQWMQMLDHTLAEAKRLNLGIDLANATGWPFGGPWITDADAAKTVVSKTFTLKGGEELSEPVTYVQEGWVRTAGSNKVTLDQLKQPVTANTDLQALAIDQVKYSGKLPLQLLMAYSDKGAAIDLTGKVDANGKLAWKAPEGKWTLYALFMGLHGKMVERAAPGGEGYAIDHFSKKALDDYLQKFDEAFRGHDVSGIRAFFNDSYEVDDARGQSNWTPDFLKEFQKRRGYDLRNYLPALFQKDAPEMNTRVLFDYRATIDELILENFTREWKAWGEKKGGLIRNQSHGSPANLLDLYGAIDIPETEGTNILRFKFATSAAHVLGKPLASSESATWLNEHFLSSWGDVKKALDLYFLGGVNHIFYHGLEYSPKNAPWPGWLFYAAVHFQPTNPQWKDFHALNEYVARTQSFLQMGRPDNDVLLYFPLYDRYSEPGRDLLQHFDGMERNFNGTDFEKVSEWMLDNDYGFDFFSERQLEKFANDGNGILTGGNRYQTILLPDNQYISLDAFNKLVNLAKGGATILVYKNLPKDVPGFARLKERQTAFQNLLAQLQFSASGSVKKASVGKGAFMMGDDMSALLQAAGVRKEALHEKGLQFNRRKNADGHTYFINNRSDKTVADWIPLNDKAASVALFDAMTGKDGLARWRKKEDGTVEVWLELKPFESCLVQTFGEKKTGNAFPYIKTAGEATPLKGNWSIEFVSGGPELPAKVTNGQLGSWTDLDGDAVKNFSGSARYSISFAKPSGRADAWLLNLGKVQVTAEVLLNGKRIATLIGPNFETVIPAASLQANNKLEIVVSNLMANRIAYMDRNRLPWKIFYNTNMPARRSENSKNGLFDASAWKPLPSGLEGPVTLTPVNYEK